MLPAQWQGQPIVLVPNAADAIHCNQCCFIMTTQALKGIEYTIAEAEQLTGFVAERPTWPHKMLLSLATLGCRVNSIERLNPQSFITNPQQELQRLFPDPDIHTEILRITDVALESQRLQECLAQPNIQFSSRPPALIDIKTVLSSQGLALACVDFSQLHGTENYEGHMVLVTQLTDTMVEIYDPGPPARAAWQLPLEKFLQAWQSPSADYAQLIQVWPEPTENQLQFPTNRVYTGCSSPLTSGNLRLTQPLNCRAPSSSTVKKTISLS